MQIHGAHIQAGVSTASMGKFDKRLVGEKDGERMPAGKRRKFMAVTDTQTERTQLTGLADKFLRERCEAYPTGQHWGDLTFMFVVSLNSVQIG